MVVKNAPKLQVDRESSGKCLASKLVGTVGGSALVVSAAE
jgi:hypothetical protein